MHALAILSLYKHAGDRTFLLCCRQGFITDRESLYSLVEKYLPLEYREEIIPTVQAGNKILLK